jgi:hypothetical protein
MDREHNNMDTDPQALADHEAVMRQVTEGTPVEPELARRVREGAERITEEIRREHGDLDVVQLLRDARKDAGNPGTVHETDLLN